MPVGVRTVEIIKYQVKVQYKNEVGKSARCKGT